MNQIASSNDAAHETGYTFPNSQSIAGERLKLLAQIFDPLSQQCLDRVPIRKGWSCWEIGAGYGTMARWLCERVGGAGMVLATDLEPRFLQPLARANLEVMQHDIVRDPCPQSAFDVVHARLLLSHLPEREQVMDRVIAALKPGGWLVIEDFDVLSLLADPQANPAECALKTHAALRELLLRRGADLRFGRRLSGRLHAHGLTQIAAEGRLFMWESGSIFTRFLRLTCEQVRDQIIHLGLITAAEFAHDVAALEINYSGPSPTLWSAVGRRPV
jgi:SAM-dependent methyltransferase